jgi:hypothetical protein
MALTIEIDHAKTRAKAAAAAGQPVVPQLVKGPILCCFREHMAGVRVPFGSPELESGAHIGLSRWLPGAPETEQIARDARARSAFRG